MVFSSPIFLFVFLPLVITIYFLSKGVRIKNSVLLIFSIIFYSWGEPGYIGLILISISLNYIFGLYITSSYKRYVLLLACLFNLGTLGFLKYSGFVSLNIDLLFNSNFNNSFKQIALPIGISFYTFQALSYVIDAYFNKVEIQKNPFDLALYITFFPQLIAGPIVRYIDVQKEIKSRSHNWEDINYGVKRFIIGLGKKVLIANSVAYYVDDILNRPINSYSTGVAVLAVILYTIQIFFDFSGYSDMAIGLGRIFGFKFPENFNYPYQSKSIKEFWRRWHITLSTWFRDYVYIQLGGSQINKRRTYINLFIVFFITGIWHGASWNFIIWGFIHGFFIIIERLGFGKVLNRIPKVFQHLYTLLVVMFAWIFFRIENLSDAISYIGKIISPTFHQSIDLDYYNYYELYAAIFFAIILSFKSKYLNLTTAGILPKILLFLIFILSIGSISSNSYNPFIYFRF